MFDVGFAELFLLSVIGLLVLGPERLPAVARTLGGWIRKARTSWYALRRSIETELAAADVSEPIKSVGEDLKRMSRDLAEAAGEPATRATAPTEVAERERPRSAATEDPGNTLGPAEPADPRDPPGPP